jgi:hypothetical protein
MIVKTLASACLFLEIRWPKWRQTDKIQAAGLGVGAILLP